MQHSRATNQWNNTSQATIKDDGQTVGSFVSVSDELSIDDGAFISDTGFTPQSITTYSVTITPSFVPFPGVKLRGTVKLMVAASFDVEAGTPTNLLCALKPTKNWAIRWTGIPQVDRVIFESGREVWSFVQEAVFDCPHAEDFLFDVTYDVQMTFAKSIQDVWRFGVKAVHNLLSSSWNNITLKPIALVSDRHKRSAAMTYPPVMEKPSAPLYDEPPALYPELNPTLLDNNIPEPQDQRKPKKPTLFGKLFKRKPKS